MHWRVYFIFSIIVSCIFCLSKCQSNIATVQVDDFLNLHDTVDYVGMRICSSCHADVHQSFIHTGMGRSFDRATPTKSDAIYDKHSLVYDEKSNFYYRPFFKDSTLFVKEFRLLDGDTIYQRTEQIAYIVGSGQHTNSHIVDVNGYIFQAPITFYTQTQKWDMAPGYQGENLRFSRLLTTECITCHNHYPSFNEASLNKYEGMPSGIECERCHGPGEVHFERMIRGQFVDTATQIDYSIVNPRHLARDLQMDLCQRCHLQGVAVLEEGKSFFDFKPGMELSEVMNVFLPRYSNSHEKFIMASQADRLRMSPCYIESPEMSCITCHNPHQSTEITSATHFNSSCQKCHQKDHCTESYLIQKQHQNNCISCHMPKSGSIDIPHVNITDHYISKETAVKKNAPISTEEKEAIAEFLGLEIMTKSNPEPLDMARGYIALYDKYVNNEIMLDSAYFYLQQTESNLSSFKTWIHYFFAKKDYSAIIQKAVTYQPMSVSDPWTTYRIGEAYFKVENYSTALLWFKQASKLQKYNLDFQEKLGLTYIKVQYLREAQQCFEFILRENPKRPVALNNLGYIYALNAQLDRAIQYYDQALQLNPDYEQALVNKLAIVHLQKQDKIVQKLVKRIQSIRPNHPDIQPFLKN